MDMLGRQRDGEKDIATIPMENKKTTYMHVLGLRHVHSWPALAWFWSVVHSHSGHRCQRVKDWYRHPRPLHPNTPRPPPAPSLNPSSSQATPGGWKPPSWTWTALELAFPSPPHGRSVNFISISHVNCLVVVLPPLHLAGWHWQTHAGSPSVAVFLSITDWMSSSSQAFDSFVDEDVPRHTGP